MLKIGCKVCLDFVFCSISEVLNLISTAQIPSNPSFARFRYAEIRPRASRCRFSVETGSRLVQHSAYLAGFYGLNVSRLEASSLERHSSCALRLLVDYTLLHGEERTSGLLR